MIFIWKKKYFDEAEYLWGFNLGYQVSKEFHDIGEILYSIRLKSDKLDGTKDRREQYIEDLQKEKSLDLEHSKSKRPDFLTKNRFNNPSLYKIHRRDMDVVKD